jgi:hypothetical protein
MMDSKASLMRRVATRWGGFLTIFCTSHPSRSSTGSSLVRMLAAIIWWYWLTVNRHRGATSGTIVDDEVIEVTRTDAYFTSLSLAFDNPQWNVKTRSPRLRFGCCLRVYFSIQFFYVCRQFSVCKLGTRSNSR